MSAPPPRGRLLEGRAVLVTGAAGGIGEAFARAAAKEGARLWLSDPGASPDGRGSDPTKVEELGRALMSAGCEVGWEARDLTMRGAPQEAVAAAKEALGRLDVVLSGAGLLCDHSLLKMDEALFERAIDLHVRATFHLTRAAARVMIDQGEGGSIVLLTGPSAFFGATRATATSAGAAAIVGLARSAAIELRKHRVRVNAIAPTARTRLTEDLPLFRGLRGGSMGPDFVAPVGLYLASDLSAEVSGEILGVAGTRLYAFHTRETTGSFGEGAPFTPWEIRDRFREFTEE